MQVFISWSGARSKTIARALYAWLPQVIQAVEPWLSSEIEKGRKWSPEISDRLSNTPFGIICLTRENLEAPWILFEAGALSKSKESYVWTLLYGLSPTDVQQPLSQFQHTVAEKLDIKKLLHTINKRVEAVGEKSLAESVLDKLFDTFWPELDNLLQSAGNQSSDSGKEIRSDRALLEEMVEILRSQDRINARYEQADRERINLSLLMQDELYRRYASNPWRDWRSFTEHNPDALKWPPPNLHRIIDKDDALSVAVRARVKGKHSDVQQMAQDITSSLSKLCTVTKGPELTWELRINFGLPVLYSDVADKLSSIAEKRSCSICDIDAWGDG